MIRMVLCDDEELVRKGMRMILESNTELQIVAEAADGIEAIEVVKSCEPDVALMDIRMPGMDGIEATRRITTDPSCATRVLVLTTFSEDRHVYDALQAGASGFLLKSAAPDELSRAITGVAAGDVLLAPEITRRLVDDYVARTKPREPLSTAELTHLTEREIEVLTHIGMGRTNSEIASELFLGEATVKTYINRLFSKLHLRDRTQAVIFAYDARLVEPGGH
jgi:DNA-binding NarL/FixJ family response regulator